MKNEILENLSKIYNSLNQLEVKGKNNCTIVSGSLGLIEDIVKNIHENLQEKETENSECKKEK